MQTACFEALRQLRSVRRSLSNDVLLTLLRALVVSEKVDCYSTVLAGIYESLFDRLQSVLNATDRLVFSARRSEHVTTLLRDLHWLKVPERIKFRLCVLTHRTWRNVHGTAPPYLTETLQLTYRHVNTSSFSVNRYANSGRPVDQSDNTRWPSVSCGCCTHLERYSLLAKSCSVTEVVQAPL